MTKANIALREISTAVRKAQAEGRDLTDTELRVLRESQAVALGELQKEIAGLRRKGEA